MRIDGVASSNSRTISQGNSAYGPQNGSCVGDLNRCPPVTKQTRNGIRLEGNLCSLCGELSKNETTDLRNNQEMINRLRVVDVPVKVVEEVVEAVCVKCVYKANSLQDVSLKWRLANLSNPKVPSKVQQKSFPSCNQFKSGENIDEVMMQSSSPIGSEEPTLNYTEVLVAEAESTELPALSSNHSSPTNTFSPCSEAEPIEVPALSSNPSSPPNTFPPCSVIATSLPQESQETILPSNLSGHTVQTSPLSQEHNEEIVTIPAADECQNIVNSPAEEEESESQTEKSVPEAIVNDPVSGSPVVTDEDDHNNSALNVMFERFECAIVTESGGNINNYHRHHCVFCPMTFPKEAELNAHSKFHPPVRSRSARSGGSSAADRRFRCPECSSTFDTRKRLREHKHIHQKRLYCRYCHAEQFNNMDHDFHEAECLGKRLAKNDPDDSITKAIRLSVRVTRSITRSIFKDNTKNDCSDDEQQRPCKRPHTTNSTEQDEDVLDEISVADTMHTAKMSYVKRWVSGVPDDISSIASTSMTRNTFALTDQQEFLSQKEYDYYQLDKLIESVDRNKITCLVTNCNYHTDSITDIIRHKVQYHKSKAWFRCKKCSGVFTDKVYLDYHLYEQDRGGFSCIKCARLFAFRHQLDRHLVQHSRLSGFKCSYCKLEYLSKEELDEHYDELPQHRQTGTRKLIKIDHSLTIVNEVPPEIPVKRKYTETTKIMNLPQTPSKTPMHLPWHKEFRVFIGDLVFQNKATKNCCGSN